MQRVAAFAQSESGKSILLATVPNTCFGECDTMLKETAEADRLLYEHGIHPSLGVENVTEQLELAKKGFMLGMGDLLKVSQVLRVSSAAKQSIGHTSAEAPLLKAYAARIFTADSLQAAIDLAIISDTEMSDNASPKLASIRQAIKRGNERLKEKIQSFITTKAYAPYLQEALVTKRDDRYVIPVKSDFRGQIKGLIHDQSASGQTVYVEPLEVVEMNNELKQLSIDEHKEIERILLDFTARVGLIADPLAVNLEVIVALDVIFARAIYGHTIDGTMPRLNERGYVRIRKGRHPLIEKHKVVANTVELGGDFDILLVTGPNTGGKTVTLKLTGLCCLMAESGLFIPAEPDSDVAVFQNVLTDIGDEQSIEQNLSTFSSHMSNVVYMVRHADENTLALIDELGAGTDPEQGAALAVAITDCLREKGVKAVITTHYGALKEYAYSTQRVENASMDFDPDTYEPLYKLIIGVPGTSNAFEIARKLGLDEQIVQNAASGVKEGSVRFEDVLMRADQMRRKAQEELDENRRLNAELEEEIRRTKQEQNKLQAEVDKLNQNARREVRRLVDIALAEVNEIVDELKKLLDEPQQAGYFKATQLRKKLERITVEEEEADDDPPMTDDEPKPGDKVFVLKFRKEAVLNSITKNGEYVVSMGNLKSIVKPSEVKKLLVQKEAAPEKPIRKQVTLGNARVKRELYLLGCTVDEALYRLENFLDEADAAKVEEVKIIHGLGTGALRNAIWEYLNESDVVSFRAGKQGEGGQGVTFVRLR